MCEVQLENFLCMLVIQHTCTAEISDRSGLNDLYDSLTIKSLTKANERLRGRRFEVQRGFLLLINSQKNGYVVFFPLNTVFK